MSASIGLSAASEKSREYPAFSTGRGNAFCLRHVGDARHVGDGGYPPCLFGYVTMWVGVSQSDAHQPIRTSVSETKEAVYRPMRGASWDEEQTMLWAIVEQISGISVFFIFQLYCVNSERIRKRQLLKKIFVRLEGSEFTSECGALNSLVPGGCIDIISIISEHILWLKFLLVKLLSGEYHRTPLMISKQWFR